MRFFLRINSCNEKTPNRGLTKIAPGCNPVEREIPGPQSPRQPALKGQKSLSRGRGMNFGKKEAGFWQNSTSEDDR